MDLFHKIEGAVAIVRLKGGLFRQVDMYARGSALFIKHGGGFLSVKAKFGSRYGTSNPDVFVEEFDAPYVRHLSGHAPFYAGS